MTSGQLETAAIALICFLGLATALVMMLKIDFTGRRDRSGDGAPSSWLDGDDGDGGD